MLIRDFKIIPESTSLEVVTLGLTGVFSSLMNVDNDQEDNGSQSGDESPPPRVTAILDSSYIGTA